MSSKRPFPRFVMLPASEWQPSGRALSLLERAIVGVVQSHLDRGEPAISYTEMTEEVGASRSAVMAACRHLERDGIITIRTSGPGRGRRAVYGWGENVRRATISKPEKMSAGRPFPALEKVRRPPSKRSESGHPSIDRDHAREITRVREASLEGLASDSDEVLPWPA